MRISKQSALTMLGLSLLMLFLAVSTTDSVNLDWNKGLDQFKSMAQMWWKLHIAFLFISVISIHIQKYNRIFAEYIGSIAWLCMTYPFLGFLMGLPYDLGLKAVLFGTGAFVLLVSVSVLMSITVLNIFKKDENKAKQL